MHLSEAKACLFYIFIITIFYTSVFEPTCILIRISAQTFGSQLFFGVWCGNSPCPKYTLVVGLINCDYLSKYC